MSSWLPDLFAVLDAVTAGAGRWAYLVVAAVVLLETSVGLGLLSPGEAVLALAGAAATGDGRLDLALLLAVVWAAGMTGDGLSFLLGRRHGPALLVRLRVPAARVDRVHGLLDARGGWVLLGGRFVGPVRVIAPFLAGSSAMTGRRFLAWDAVGVALWGWSYVAIGFLFAGSVRGASATFGQAAILAVAVGLGAAVGLRALRRRRRRRVGVA